jgi:thioesterase DpgC
MNEEAAQAPPPTSDYEQDRRRFGLFWTESAAQLQRLPVKPQRSVAEAATAAALLAAARQSRETFLGAHAQRVYDNLTDRGAKLLRLDALVYAAAARFPGLVPTREAIAAEALLDQRDKEGVEIDQGIFLAHMLAGEERGLSLCQAMRLALPESRELAAQFARDNVLDLGSARLERRGPAVHLTAANPQVLNAEDDTTLAAMERAVDVAILDRGSEVAVLRGAFVTHTKYAGRRLFGAGINLTRLYRGRIPYLWFLERDMGYLHKLVRGVAEEGASPGELAGHDIEKPWVAAVDGFAIGGHCQLLLCVDYVLAAADAYMTLPARKEGIIPGFANLRLPRFIGERLTRQAIQHGRRLDCDSPEGRLICDEIAPADAMDAALARVLAEIGNSGAVSLIGNRRALRIGLEPLHLFRRYGSVYAREQAYCHFSPALIDNLERHWDAAHRRL